MKYKRMTVIFDILNRKINLPDSELSAFYGFWFLHKILRTKIFSVVVELTSLVSKIVVEALTSWLHVTSEKPVDQQ